jgi:DNA-binding transcriptional LysR family regulator
MFEKLFAQRGLSLERLRALVETADFGTITKAAKNDPTRASQYSRQISELERFFGLELGERRGRRFVLNEAGHRLAKIGRETLISLENYKASGPTATVTVAVGGYDSVFHWLIIPRIRAVERAFPQVSWVFRHHNTAGIVQGLNELTLDIGTLRANAVGRPLKGEQLFKMTYSVFAPKSLINGKHNDYKSILKSIPLALPHSEGDFRRALDRGIAENGVPLDVRLNCQSAVEACRAVVSGGYCSILPSIAKETLDEKRFACIEMPWLRGYERNICLAWNPRILELRPMLKKAISALTDALSNAVAGK